MDSSSDEDPFLQQNVLRKLKLRKIAVQQEQELHPIGMASSSSRRQSKPIEKSEPPRVRYPKQLAEQRLKRLQTNLKDKNHEDTSSSRSSTNSKSRSRRSSVFDAWKKPQALINASNRLKSADNDSSSSSSSANERLRQMRASLQQQQKKKEVKEEHVIKQTNNKKSPQNIPQNVPKIDSNVEPEPMDWEDYDVSMAILHSLQRDSEEQQLPDRCLDHMYFILDTNVLIHNLSFVKDLPKLIMEGLAGSMIFIPYVVIKELDRLKAKHSDSEINRVAAIRAIHYLNSKFDDSRDIQAQSALDEAEHLINIDSADDSILNCCLQLKEQVPNSMLLTNDSNLRLKAKATSIRVSCKSELMAEYPDIFDFLRLSK